MANYITARANGLVFGAVAALLMLIGGLTWEGMEAAHASRGWAMHATVVLGALTDLDAGLQAAESGARGYLLTGNDDYLPSYETALGRVTSVQGELQRLTADNPAQQERLRLLAPVLQHKLEVMAQCVQMRRADGLDAAVRLMRNQAGLNLKQQIETTIAAMTANEQGVLTEHLGSTVRRAGKVRWLVFGGTGLAILSLLAAARRLNRAWRHAGRMEAEQRSLALQLRASLDSLSQGVAVFDASRDLIQWNECFQVLLALPKAMVRVGTPYAAFAEHTAEAGAAFLETQDQIRSGGAAPGEPVTYERARADGHHLEVRRTPMPDGGFVLTISDMTRRVQAEVVLREAQKMQAIGQLTGGIAHDFNNLLTIIVGNLEFARAKLDAGHTLQARIERALWAAQRGGTLTSQLLAFARKQVLEPAAIDLAATMPELVPLLRRTLGERIDVRYIETAGLWPAMADPAQLESAVLNLALNARDAMPDGGRLTIELGNTALDDAYARSHAEVTAGDYTMLAVSDTGDGMTPEVMARVFEPFFTTKAPDRGTGLGLAMVFGFVKQSGGHVKIYSELGEGTTVRIYLPRAADAAVPSVRHRETPDELPHGSATILVVEDEAAVREIAVAILEDLGYRVLEAANGEEGLRVFGANMGDIDLLLTDVVMPGRLRGREMAERITAMRPEVRVLFMSGYTENSIVHHGRLDAGVQLLGKPFRREQLARKVAEMLAIAVPVAASVDGGTNVVNMTYRRNS